MRKAFTAAMVLAVAVAWPAAAGSASPENPGSALDLSAARKAVTYHGYQIVVPASWRVVDLTAHPLSCVRFDKPAVYLGAQTGQPDCPSRLVGRVAGVVVEPLASVARDRINRDIGIAPAGSAVPHVGTPSRQGTIQVAVQDAGVLVTGAHTAGNESAVRRILGTARLVPGGRPTKLPRPAGRIAAAPIVAPGTLRDKGFDICAAPSQGAMDAWRASPYKAVGIYSSGGLRACSQPNLTPSWVASQHAKGWRFILIDVGRQAPCTGYRLRMSYDKATARQQGRDAAASAVSAATGLGFGPGSAIYSDIEGYDSTASCKAAVLSYVSGWTSALNDRGWLSGVYSSASSGIRDLASAYNDGQYVRPDHIWFAWWNGKADTDTGSYAPASYWANHQRLHQYAGEVAETWGGVRLPGIDRNYLDVEARTPACIHANLDFTAYPTLQAGSSGSAVTAAQCLLESAGFDPGPGDPTGTFDQGTVDAAKGFQTKIALPVTGEVGARTWTALLSAGDRPTLSNGSTGPAVRRLQRALTAALSRTVAIDGIFGDNTGQAVRSYQSSRGLGSDGIVGSLTWAALQSGK